MIEKANTSLSVEHRVPVVMNKGEGCSYFSHRTVTLSGGLERLLSDQQQAVNFRWRTSPSGYVSDFHVAGDSTLLVILSGTLMIELRDGTKQCFSAGDYFIADDYLAADMVFDASVHGHKAYVVGEQSLTAIHIKLDKRL